jgi:hypothetical protein
MHWMSRLTPDVSSWKGYWQGKRRRDEVLFVP